MDTNRILALISVVLAAISAVLGFLDREGVTAFASSLALCLSVLALKYCSENVSKYTFIMSLVVLICTTLMATLTSHEFLVEDGNMSRDTWIYVSAIVRTIAIFPMIIMFYFVVAAMFDASYNWAVTAALSPFIGIGMMVPGYVVMYIIQWNDIDAEVIMNANIVIGLMVSLISFIVFTLILRHVFLKNRYLITKNGLEVMS